MNNNLTNVAQKTSKSNKFKKTNRYKQTNYVHGGKPHNTPTGELTLFEDGKGILDVNAKLSYLVWNKSTKDQLVLLNEEGKIMDIFVTYKNRTDTLFSFGSQLKLIKRGFILDIAPLYDNPKDPLNNIVTKSHPNVRRISNRKDEMLNLLPKNAVVAEIGVNFGNFAMDILQQTNPAKFHLIDCWEEQDFNHTSDVYQDAQQKQALKEVGQKFQKQIDSKNVIINRGFSQDVLPKFADKYFDWVYIDASHRFEDCLRDLKLCEPKVKKNGYIAGHDYCNSDIAEKRNYGVMKAVDIFCSTYGWEMIYLTIEHPEWPFQSYVLQRKSESVKINQQ